MHCIDAHVGFALLSLQCGFGYLGRLRLFLNLHECVLLERELKQGMKEEEERL